MGNLPRSKISMEYSSEDNYNSINSPSFTDLVCTQDLQQSKPLPAPSSQLKQEAPEFEFSPAKPNSITHDLYKNSSADMFVFKNQLQLHDFLGQTKQSQDEKKPLSQEQYAPESCDTQCMKTSGKVDHKVRKQTKKKRTATSSLIGRKLCRLLSPCRECKTIQPTVKAH